MQSVKILALALVIVTLGFVKVCAQENANEESYDPNLENIQAPENPLDPAIESKLDTNIVTTTDVISHDHYRPGAGLQPSESDPTTGYLVTQRDNPLLDEECRAEALSAGVRSLAEKKGWTLDAAFDRAKDHMEGRQEGFPQASFTEWIEHVAVCDDLCRPIVVKLLACHVQAVSEHEHMLIYFDFDNSDVRTSEEMAIRFFIKDLKSDESKRILLIGRASRTPGDPEYNRSLSRSRAEAARAALVRLGIAFSRIKLQGIGYEEPQLDGGIAEVYGVSEAYQQIGKLAMNQSVLVVAY